MNYEERLTQVSVLGAAGKMGSGILLLTALEMADLSLLPENKGKVFMLNAIDVSPQGLNGLMKYLQSQVMKAAEKKMVQLRGMYADRKDLVENSEIVNEYVNDVLRIIRPGSRIENTYDSYLIFEAIKEDPALKVSIFSEIEKNNPNKPWYFTNTSSIPITELDAKANLGGRVIGFHFYNPPAVQKLVELIRSKTTLDEVNAFALVYAKNLRKTVVPSNDVAGFIGNGHFMRDLLYGISEVEALAKNYPFTESLWMINRVTQDFLVRPMGIFQLADYVGIDVCQYIMSVMNPYMKDENLHSELLDRLVNMGIKGGQYSDGTQKDGFFKYDKGRPIAVFAPDKNEYVAIADIQGNVDFRLGALSANALQWKNVVKSATKSDLLKNHFASLKTSETKGAELALAYNKRSGEIGRKLVSDGVAMHEQDVNTVLLTGFFHAYGPINEY